MSVYLLHHLWNFFSFSSPQNTVSQQLTFFSLSKPTNKMTDIWMKFGVTGAWLGGPFTAMVTRYVSLLMPDWVKRKVFPPPPPPPPHPLEKVIGELMTAINHLTDELRAGRGAVERGGGELTAATSCPPSGTASLP